jgi:hypothetical protein
MPSVALINAVITMIQVVAELGKQAGMDEREMNRHFYESWAKIEGKDPDSLPDAGSPTDG